MNQQSKKNKNLIVGIVLVVCLFAASLAFNLCRQKEVLAAENSLMQEIADSQQEAVSDEAASVVLLEKEEELGTVAQDEETEPETESETEAEEEACYVVSVTESEIDEMARIVWLEVGQSQYYTQYLTACVMVNRLLDWNYDSMTEVIFAKNQYSTANKYTNWGGGSLTVSDEAYEAVYEALTCPDRNVHYQDSKTANNGKTLYWQDPVSGAKIYY